MMPDAAWLNLIMSVVVSVGCAALAFGMLRSDMRSLERNAAKLEKWLEAAMAELRASRDKLGERLGELEKWQAVEESRSFTKRGQ